MNTIYIEPFSGLSGDMLLSALCELADFHEEIVKLPGKLHLPDGKVVIEKANKNGIVCKHVKIIDLNEEGADGHKHAHDHHHHHTHDHAHGNEEHHHDHSHSHSHDHHHHTHRHLKDILQIIEKGHVSTGAKEIAKTIFNIIGTSEAKIHNMDLETIHFHEVSGVDSILDIVGCAVLIDHLQITKAYSDPICTGFGMVKTQHGLLPVPAPATADILMNLPTYRGEEKGERVTPTGAAILKFLNPEFVVPEIRRTKIAYGPGQKDFIGPNVVRVSLLESGKKKSTSPPLIIIETNIDDLSSELLGEGFQADLLQEGAIDFYFTAIQMKKGRPGWKLSIFARADNLDALSAFLLEQTSSIGIRYYSIDRKILERRYLEMETKYGRIKLKEVIRPSGTKSYKIEHESLRKLKELHNISIFKLEEELYPLIREEFR